ncbi:MAG: hypothetical protein Q8P50_07770 [Bacillota bacterium]|nr:hypothetical protein [Bacillota bacterium]
MNDNFGCHQPGGHFHGHQSECCHPRHEESKEMQLARLKAALLVLQAREKEIENRIKHMEECEKTCE